MNFIKYLIVLILIYNIGDLKAIENKIAFTVENEIYTSIDLENRKKYLQSIRLTQNIGTDLEIIEDYITTILFYLENNKKDMNLLDEAEKLYNKIKEDFDLVDNKDEFKKNFYSLDKRIYIEYLNYDLNRRKIIEKMIQKRTNEINKFNNNEILIFDIFIQYLSINNEDKEFVLSNKNEINLSDLNQVLKFFDENKILYNYSNKKVTNFDTLNKDFKNLILSNKNTFLLELGDNIIMGNIEKKYKRTEEINISIYKIESQNIIEKKELVCDNINNIKNFNKTKIIKFDDVKLSGLNEQLQKKLIKKNDYLDLSTKSSYVYAILCEISYNQDIFKKIYRDEKISYIANEIEKDFLQNRNKKFEILINE